MIELRFTFIYFYIFICVCIWKSGKNCLENVWHLLLYVSRFERLPMLDLNSTFEATNANIVRQSILEKKKTQSPERE